MLAVMLQMQHGHLSVECWLAGDEDSAAHPTNGQAGRTKLAQMRSREQQALQHVRSRWHRQRRAENLRRICSALGGSLAPAVMRSARRRLNTRMGRCRMISA